MKIVIDVYCEVEVEGAKRNEKFSTRMLDGESLEAYAERMKQVILSIPKDGVDG